jgi:Domain of unknown function (DUF4114)
MTEIKLGQTIAASLTSNDTQSVDPTSPLNGAYYNDYDLSGLDSFRQLKITVQRPAGANSSTMLELIDAATGEIIAHSMQAGVASLAVTTFPGVTYKLRVANASLGEYQLSLIDGGKATSIVSPYTANVLDPNTNSLVGTIGQSGTYFSLASGGALNLTDVAFSVDGQFYGVGAAATTARLDLLYRIDPSLDRSAQVKLVSEIIDTQGNGLSSGIQALEFANNKLYGLGYAAEGAQLYQIDVNTSMATTVATLPQSFLIGGDLVYDAANQRFLATSLDASNTSNDALWQIPLGNPTGATKLGMTGFTDVYGLVLENGQLFGYTAHVVPGATGSTRIKIDPTTGKGTFDRAVTGTHTFGIGGATTISGSATDGMVLNVVNLDSSKPIIAIDPNLPAQTIDLSKYTPGQSVQADITVTSSAAYTNNLGFYIVEDAIGTIKLADGSTLQPGDANYAIAAVKNAVFQATQTETKIGQELSGSRIYAPVVVAQGTLTDFVTKNPTNSGGANHVHAYFNYVSANADNTNHFRLLANNTFGVEDMYGGGDRDFNDLIVKIDIKIG